MEELAKILERIASLSTDELLALEARIREEIATASDAEELSDELIAQMGALADGLDAVRAEQTSREERAAELEAQREEILNRVNPVAETPPDPEPDPTPEPEVEPETDPQPVSTAETPEPEAAPAIAAAAITRPRISDIAARRPAVAKVTAKPEGLPVSLVAAADVPGHSAGSAMTWGADVERAFIKKREAVGKGGSGEFVPVLSMRFDYPEERQLSDTDIRINAQRLAEVTGPAALAASGGLCAPLTPLYSQAMISSPARPVRDALASFQATRGGITFIPPLKLSQAASAVDEWTVTTDTTPGNTTKTVWTVPCASPTTVQVQAITRILKFGNLGARAFPERVTEALDLAMAAHARFAERELIEQIGTNSTAVTAGAVGNGQLGSTRELLRIIDRAVAQYRNRHRMAPEAVLQLMIPDWADDMTRADLSAELPGATAERLATSDAMIDAFYAARNVQLIRMLEGEAGTTQDFATQGVGALLGWPAAVIMYLFHPGAHLFLDAGTLDLGLVRDSTLNSTNDYEMFAETFEAAAFVGVESLKITATVCADGKTSAATDYEPCTLGS